MSNYTIAFLNTLKTNSIIPEWCKSAMKQMTACYGQMVRLQQT
jgi:hypothetical protein